LNPQLVQFRPTSARLRSIAGLSALALAVALPTALADASGTHPRLQLQKTKLGSILVDHNGYTVYTFSTDKRNYDSCVPINQCLVSWPPVTPGAGPLAGKGVKRSLIGTIRLKHGGKQLTYAGRPLYTYSQDTHPAETRYVNLLQFQGYWPAINASGKDVK
jgi:predicted lipoprotein with Yx(FWY)xxD motif